MVNRLRLNEKSVREAAPVKGRDYQIFDTEVRGFAVCVYRSGNRAFTLDYRHAGRQRRMTIGRWPEWSTTAARERAKELRRDIDAGADPLGQREDGREAPRVQDMIERYIEVHLPNLAPNNASDQKSLLIKLVGPEWNNRLVTEITPYDVEKLLNKIAAGRARPSKTKPNNRARKLQGAKPTPVRANRVGEVLRKMFTYAESWGWCEANPASGFRRRIENPRERFLTQEEIGRLATALDAAEDRRAADIIRLCMLTGARVGEVRQARFEHFNLEHLSWSKPASMTKQRRIHRLPISDEAAAIVRQRLLMVPRGCAWLFPGDVPGQPVTEIRRFWRGIQREVNIADVRIHDLRHTFASLLVSGGASLEMIGKLLGHSQLQTTQRYAHLMDSPLRAGVDAVASAFRPRPKLVHDADVKPLLMVTDPPYGVAYDPSWRNQAGAAKTKRTGKVLNDDRADWREAWALFPGDVAYVWHGALHAAEVAESLAAAGFSIRSQIIWAKDRLVLSRGDYHWQHEPCWYAVKKTGKGHWAGDRKQTTLWQIANKDQDAETVHGTQKPVECMRRPILNNSSPGQAVFEPFMGSGTTLIAAENTGRVCFGIELNPVYVDVAVERWQQFTGETAVLDGTGETFADLKARRLAA